MKKNVHKMKKENWKKYKYENMKKETNSKNKDRLINK